MPHDMEDVAEKLSRAAKNYAERRVAQYVARAELRLARQEACAGNAQLSMKHARETIAELEKRVAELERISATRKSGKGAEVRRLRFG
jgi:adenosine deaminase